MSNPFERHGIRHLSASSLNAWAMQPALFGMERLLKRRAPVGLAAHRGSAVERGVSEGLFNPDVEVGACEAIALREFDTLSALSGDPDRSKERDAVPQMVRTVLPALRHYGPPEAPQAGEHQHRVEIMLDDVPVPVIGYLDWHWPARKLVVDLKTTHRVPSALSTAHARQGAIYARGTGHDAWFCYASPKRAQALMVEDVASHLAALREIALRLGRFLALSTDPHELCGLLVPDFDHFTWQSQAARSAGRETYGW